MLSVNDILVADLLLIASYGFYVFLFFLLLYSLFTAVKAFRGRISWGKARVMGVPFAFFVWIQITFYLLLLDAAYSLVGLILRTPLWLDLAISLGIIVLAWWIFWRLSKRSTFKRYLFFSLVMVPLGIPGAHVVGQVAQTGAIEVSQKVGIGFLKYGDSLDGLALKNVDNVVEAVPIIRHFPQTVKTVAGEITFRNSFEKGLLGDALTAKRLTALGYTKLPSKYNMVNGIDGVFIKRNTAGNVIELVIIENKVDAGRLAFKQMSDEWVLDRASKMITSGDAGVRKTGELVRDTLQRQPSLVRKELWQHYLSDGSTTVRAVDSNGKPGTVLREWADGFIRNQLLDRCTRQVYQCNFSMP